MSAGQPATTFPTAEDAIAYRQAHDKRMKELYRKSMPALRAIVAEHHQYVLGGPVSKEEHIRQILDDEFSHDRLNESIHVLHHRDWVSDICEWCPKEGTQ